MPSIAAASFMRDRQRLLADIGGTNARFAWQEADQQTLQCIEVLQCQDHASLHDAAIFWLKKNGLPLPAHAAIAVACPVQSDRVQLTNNNWSFSIQVLKSQLGLSELVVVNDFTALALALPLIEPSHLNQLGADPQKPFTRREPVALLGAGTGLGVSGLLPGPDGRWVPLSGEGGHISLAVHDDLQYRIWSLLKNKYGHVSAERVLSGQGIVNIYACLISIDRGEWAEMDMPPSEVTALALESRDPTAIQALRLFCSWLGSAAGDLALTLGATGGVFIGGGVAPRLGNFLNESDFRSRFEGKGRFSSFLKPIPVWVIDTPSSAALNGASTLLT